MRIVYLTYNKEFEFIIEDGLLLVSEKETVCHAPFDLDKLELDKQFELYGISLISDCAIDQVLDSVNCYLNVNDWGKWQILNGLKINTQIPITLKELSDSKIIIGKTDIFYGTPNKPYNLTVYIRCVQ